MESQISMINPMDMKPDIYPGLNQDFNCINPVIQFGNFPGLNPGINPINPVTNPIIKPFINSDMNPGLSPMIPTNNNMMIFNQMNCKNQMNVTSIKIVKEFKLCQNDSELLQIGCTFGLINPNNIFQWKVLMIGPKGTPYENGVFTINILFPKNYPEKGPEFRFVNKIYHLNVDWRDKDEKGNPGNGHICLSSLNDWSSTGKVFNKPGFSVKEAILEIFNLFHNQIIDTPYDNAIAEQYKNNRAKFENVAREWTKNYANYAE